MCNFAEQFKKSIKVSEMEKEYIINGIAYSYQNHFDDDLFEARLIDFETGNVFLSRYGETKKEAECELSDAIEEEGLQPGIDNIVVKWDDLEPETAHKIECFGQKLKSELMGEWLTDESRWQQWKEIMEARYADVYPHKYKRFEYDRWKINKIKKKK